MVLGVSGVFGATGEIGASDTVGAVAGGGGVCAVVGVWAQASKLTLKVSAVNATRNVEKMLVADMASSC